MASAEETSADGHQGPPLPPFDFTKSYQRVVLKNIQADIQVGLYPWEQHPERPTRVLVNVELFANVERLSEDSNTILSYDIVRDHIKNEWPKRPHRPLLESWIEELVELCFQYPGVQACRVSIMKPDIFSEADAAGVEVFRLRPA